MLLSIAAEILEALQEKWALKMQIPIKFTREISSC